MLDLNLLIQQANDLAPLPASTVRLAQLVENPNCHLDDVSELIAFDQALTVRLIRASNSAASAPSCPARTAKEAVLRLGSAQVLALVVACGARPILQARIPAYGMDEGALWRHSVAAAVAAETAPNYCQIEVPPETFTAALLHDIGKLIMGRFLNPEILKFMRQAQEIDQISPLEAESLLLNVHHGELGGLIAQHWNLPERIVRGITYHHDPEKGLDVICDLVYLANHVAKSIEAAIIGHVDDTPILPSVAERLELTPEAFSKLLPAAVQRYADVSSRYQMV